MKTDGALPILKSYYYTMMISRVVFEIRNYRKVISDHYDKHVYGETRACLWDFFGRNDAKAETPVLWPPHAKS